MPYLIHYLDEIARQQQRGLLHIIFGPSHPDEAHRWHWEKCQTRKMVINWLDENNYEWHECGHINWRNGWVIYGYEGWIYCKRSAISS